MQLLFGFLELGNVNPDTVYEPGLAILPAYHSGFAVEPDNAPIAGENAINRFQGRAAEKHFRSLNAPALPVIGMDVVIPANRIIEPFFTCESKHLFDLRADVGFAHTTVQKSHENHSGNLLDKDAVSVLDAGEVLCLIGSRTVGGGNALGKSELAGDLRQLEKSFVGAYLLRR
jgi:hypothetical protein